MNDRLSRHVYTRRLAFARFPFELLAVVGDAETAGSTRHHNGPEHDPSDAFCSAQVEHFSKRGGNARKCRFVNSGEGTFDETVVIDRA